MEYLQYAKRLAEVYDGYYQSFKPYYKWNTFNTNNHRKYDYPRYLGFKPYYKWNTFNTNVNSRDIEFTVYCFKPYYKWNTFNTGYKLWYPTIYGCYVLNLIINGIPSIH